MGDTQRPGQVTVQAGRCDRAVVLANEALQIAEKALGPDHPDEATSLKNAAVLYTITCRENAAEELDKRAAAIRRIKR